MYDFLYDNRSLENMSSGKMKKNNIAISQNLRIMSYCQTLFPDKGRSNEIWDNKEKRETSETT